MKRSIRTRLLVLVMCLFVLAGTCVPCFAVLPSLPDKLLEPEPGNTREKNPEVYNYAWLNTVIVRDGSVSVLPCTITPAQQDLYLYTPEEFKAETREYMTLYELNTENIRQSVYTVVSVTCRYLESMGFKPPDDTKMYRALTDYGISFAQSDSMLTELYAKLLYYCIENDAFYILFGRRIEIPRGITADHAVAVYLAEAMNTPLPSGIDTVTGFILLVMREVSPEPLDLPVSDNPDEDEAFFWAQYAIAVQNGFQVPDGAYDDMSELQKKYVQYAYYAAILKVKFKVTVEPTALWRVMENGNEEDIFTLIVCSMLEESGIAYDETASFQALFNLACENGWFPLEQEFYSDVYEYDITVPYECKKVWFTCFSLCEALTDANPAYFSMTVNGTPVSSAQSYGVDFLSARSMPVTVRTAYNDGSEYSTASYVFHLRRAAKGTETAPQQDNDIISSIEDAILSALPQDNEQVKQRVSGLFDIVDEAVGDIAGYTVVTTYPVSEYGTAAPSAAQQTTGEDCSTQQDETGKAVFTTYGEVTDTSAYPSFSAAQQQEPREETVFDRAATVLSKNPVAVATPVSVAAIGTAVGLLLSRKRRENDGGIDTEETDKNENDRSI